MRNSYLGLFPEVHRYDSVPLVGASSMVKASATSPFDAEAAGYDATFSSSLLGTSMRRVVWRRLDACFEAGDRVLDLGCGTGEDAVFLARRGIRVLATDRSPEMVDVAKRKIEEAGLARRAEVRLLSIEELPAGLDRPFDGVLSNFGALNCVADLPAAARGIAACLQPGARAHEGGAAARRLSRQDRPSRRGALARHPDLRHRGVVGAWPVRH